MKKLLQLLNEYKEGKPFQFTGYDEEYGMFETNLNMNGNTSLPAETIICKKFGFIQRLVENDKIDKDRADNVLFETEMFKRDPHTDFTERLLMYLAISDDSINFLISILE